MSLRPVEAGVSSPGWIKMSTILVLVSSSFCFVSYLGQLLLRRYIELWSKIQIQVWHSIIVYEPWTRLI